MRDVMVLFGVLALLPLAMSNAFVAYLIWGWTALASVDSYVYGFMMGARLNFIFGVIGLVMIMARRDVVRGRIGFETPTVVLLMLFLLQITISVMAAYPGNSRNLELYDRVIKCLIFALAMPLVVVGRDRIHAMVVMVCLGLGFHGIIDGLKFLSSGGVHNVHGLIKFGDNNHYAVLMVMVIPLTIYLSRYLEQRLLRLAANGATILLIAAVIGTNSRGGLISLLAMGGWLVMTSRQKLAGLMMFVAGGLLVLAMAPESWFQRMDTIKEADEDSSFMSRIEAWQVSSAIALARPVTGGGLHAVQVQSVWNQYKGQTGLLPFVSDVPTSEVFRAAHSIYFEVLGDTGFIGLLLFVLIMLRGLRNGREMERAAARAPERFGWAVDLSRSLSAVVFSFMVGGASVSLAYYEILYIVIMLTEVLRRTVLAEVSGPIQARRVHVPH